MTKWILAAGAAALAIASPALAERGGHGGGKGGGQAAKAEKGGGNARGGSGHALKADPGGKQGGRSIQSFADRGHGNKASQAIQGKGRNDNRVVVQSRDFDKHGARAVRIDDDRFDRRFASNGLIDGCPPGLAKKHNGCMPPGQAKKLIGTRWNSPLQAALLTGSFRNWYPDNNDYLYRERDGYVYRINRDRGLIDGLFPMFTNDGNYFAVGQRYPLDYGFYNVPMQYQPYYADNGNYLYRYGDGGIYQLNRSTGVIEGIAALLAGDLGVGQRLPLGYDAYNVPYAYRDQYYDTADNWYRYNDGYIYRVDPKTQLIQAVISALI